MTEITLYNTRTRRKEPFRPLDPANVRMYVCGPTVYDRAHIGNARPVVVFDMLYRLLRHVYGAGHVTYVRNITDVDDKINARAAETGRPIGAITEETIRWYHQDMGALGALPLPEKHEPRATQYIPQMIAMIETLIARGHAYPAEGHVLFEVKTYDDYGKLSRRSLDEMRAGARVEVAPYKRDPMDFVLWKPSDATQPGWPGPKVDGKEVSRGRPGWHIECSAMAEALLGASFDIHGGGIDLAFPHHENEVAQSRCAHPKAGFANVWMHNGFLQVEGEKMAKSSGNFFTVRDLLDQGVPGEVIRFVLLSTNYRKPLDWSEEKAQVARNHLRRLWSVVGSEEVQEVSRMVPDEVLLPLANDLDTHGAIQALFRLELEGRVAELAAGAHLLGLLERNADYDAITELAWLSEEVRGEIEEAIYRWSELRVEAKISKDSSIFKKADRLRDGLIGLGIQPVARDDDSGDWQYPNPTILSDAESDEIRRQIQELVKESYS